MLGRTKSRKARRIGSGPAGPSRELPAAMHTSPRPRTSAHALEQMTRRRIGWHDVDLALRFGKELHRAGAVFYVLRRCDLPKDLRRDPAAQRAEGTTVVVEHGIVSTVYRNRDVRHLKRKAKRSKDAPTARRLRLLDADGCLVGFGLDVRGVERAPARFAEIDSTSGQRKPSSDVSKRGDHR